MTAPRRPNGPSRHQPHLAFVTGTNSEPPPDPAESPEGLASQYGGLLPMRVAYSVAEVAFITGLSRDMLYQQMRTGELLYLKVGRRRLITRWNLEAFLTSHVV